MKKILRVKKQLLWKLLLVMGISALVIGTTLAYFVSETAQAENKFKSSFVNIAVMQEGDANSYEDNAQGRSNILNVASTGNLENFYIFNKDTAEYPTGDTYVRVRLVPICRDANGNGTGIEVEVAFNAVEDSDWEVRNGYWYYKHSLAPNELTSQFDIDTSGAVIPNGYTLEVQILADGIQAYIEGMDYDEVWDITE